MSANPTLPPLQDDEDEDNTLQTIQLVRSYDSEVSARVAENMTSRIMRNYPAIAVILVALAIFGLLGPLGVLGNGSSPTPRTETVNAFLSDSSLLDVDAPPIPLSEEDVARMQQERLDESPHGETQLTVGEALALGASEEDAPKLPFPIIDASDDYIPKTPIIIRAADALECRDSVINFVINATDAKDECEGLKKAFDKTCNGESKEESKPVSENSQVTTPPVQNRRRLFESKTKDPNWTVFSYRLSRALHRLVKKLFARREEETFFFADELIGGDAYEEARYQVDNNLDQAVLDDVRRRLEAGREERRLAAEPFDTIEPPTPRAGQASQFEAEEEKSREENNLVEGEQINSEEDKETEIATKLPEESTSLEKSGFASESPPEKETTKEKPKQSLSLPTSSQHVSGQVLTETLMLQKESDVIAASAKVSTNQTNVTRTDAQVDAEASSKAVSDTSAAVSALLNDPDSVEARTCCASILNVFHENCDAPGEEIVSDRKLIIIVIIIAFCGMVKSLIRHFQIRWLPEAAGCILVGVLCGAVCSFIPHYDFSFDGDWFLRIMVPPIVFEAALSIDKKSFNRHIVPILFYAVAGTLMATVITAFIVHRGTVALGGWCETIPYVESLTFGALISSIDPIAVLSVLSNMGMTDTDTIYVVIFGESLLNDGVAIVLFQTLVHFLDESLVIDSEAIAAAAIHFCVIAFGSVAVGYISGMICTIYYFAFHGCQTPLVEVLMFFCWAFIPYYVCDGVGWSGIVAVVTTGFVMDLYVVGLHSSDTGSTANGDQTISNVSQKKNDRSLWKRAFTRQGHLSSVARTHVGFVTEILATMMETAIFAYLGFFLFSYRYHWNFWHTGIAIFGCCASRAIMIPSLSFVANWMTNLQQLRNNCRGQNVHRRNPPTPSGVIVDPRMQTVLWFAGLRGAMSFALVENIPLYDTVTGEGSRLKPEMKAMTSASIVFTVFVLGGYTFYVIERLGLAPNTVKESSSFELASLIPTMPGKAALDRLKSGPDSHANDRDEYESSSPRNSQTFRQRQKSDNSTGSSVDHATTI